MGTSVTTSVIVLVRFQSGRSYEHAVADDREAQKTVEGWQRYGGLWVVDPAARVRVFCPWHTVSEVVIPSVPYTRVVGGTGRAVRAAPPLPAVGRVIDAVNPATGARA